MNDPAKTDIQARQYVVAVREHHHGEAGAEAFTARKSLAAAYLDAEQYDDAIEILLRAVIDAGRLFGPSDERTWRTRLDLGMAYGGWAPSRCVRHLVGPGRRRGRQSEWEAHPS